jgi:1-acyl-sn-glycerol-3-phosphate acyltransferase
MIYPQKNKLINWFFHGYILRLVDKSFQQVKYNPLSVKSDKSVLLLANHFSWWDGFLMYYLNHNLFKKRFHVMVIEETVQKVSFFKYMGAFSVQKNSRDVVASLNYSAELLNDPQNLVLIFPQGKLFSNFTGEVVFEKGLVKVIQHAAGKFQTVLAATFIENLQYKKPTASVYLTVADISGSESIAELQQVYQKHYYNAKKQQTQIAV